MKIQSEKTKFGKKIKVLTPNGFVPITKVFKTEPENMVVIETKFSSLKCSTNHIIEIDSKDQLYAKDISIGDVILTKNGPEKVIRKRSLKKKDNCFDLSIDNEDRIYYTNGVHSHNSGVGKSFLCMSTAREAQKAGYQVVYFDSENAIDADFARNLGVDPELLMHIPVKTISQFRNEALKLMREWRENPDTKDIPMIMFCDSIGGLVGTKELNDAEVAKSAADMGQRAKELRACARVLTMECAEKEIPLIVTNHTYEVQNMMAAPTIKMSGGEGFVYATSGIIILQNKVVKEGEGKDSEGRMISQKVASIVIATSEKNRLVPVGNRGYIYIDYRRGVNCLYGLLDDAINHGFVEQNGAWFTIKDKDGNALKKVQKKDLYSREVWDPILKDLSEKIENSMKFSRVGLEGSDVPPYKLDGEEEAVEEEEPDKKD